MPDEKVLSQPESAEVAPVAANAGPARGAVAEWTVTILLLLFGTTTLVQAFVIPTGSMEDTLLIGDHLLVDKLTYAPAGPVSKYFLPYSSPKRGDIIVFRYPVDITQTFVKRIVGVPGDRIRIVNKQFFLNGKPVEEPHVYYKHPFITDYRDNFPSDPDSQVLNRGLDMLGRNIEGDELVVPPDSYFAMGDNRDSSLDSRYWGFVPRSNIIGKPLIIYWSYETETARLVNSGIDLDHLRDLAVNFFKKTRWKRTFMLIRGSEIKN